MRLQDYDSEQTFTATVLQNTAITSKEAAEEVRELVLEVSQSNFQYKIGQSVGVIVPGVEEIGHPHHFRLYTVADTPQFTEKGYPEIKLCVRRCSYIDEYSGEHYQGIASNYLCDRRKGDTLTINGPFGTPFPVPESKTADLLLIGLGTGIAPFRAFIKHLYRDVKDWKGRVKLYYGARTGLELLYMNDKKDDFTQYYDEDTFEAVKSLSDRPHWTNTTDLDKVIEERAEEILSMLSNHLGYTYIAGRPELLVSLDKVLIKAMGTKEKWEELKASLKDEQRWIELIY